MTDNLSERQRLLLARLKSGQARINPVPRTIARMEGDGLRPLSRAQKRLVFEEELYPGNVFNGSLTIEYSGALDVDCLQKALDILMERHEILRSNAEFAGDEPKLRIHRPSRVPMDIFRIGAEPDALVRAERLARKQVGRRIDIWKDETLLNATVIEIASDRFLIVLAMHMFAFDAPSGAILARELVLAYVALKSGSAPQLAALDYQYADYVAWELGQPARSFADGLAYWRQALRRSDEELELPCDNARGETATFEAIRQPFAIPSHVVSELRSLAQRNGLSFYMVLLSALQVLLFRHTVQRLVSVGAWTVQRNAANAELIGPFVNTVVYRTELSETDTFLDVLGKAKTIAAGAYAHGHVPFEEVVAALYPQRNSVINPLFRVHFILQEVGERQSLAGFRLSDFDALVGASGGYDIELVMRSLEWGLTGHFELNAALFDGVSARALADRFVELLDQVARQPAKSIGHLKFAHTLERLEPASLPPAPKLEEVLERLSIRKPESPAVIGPTGRITTSAQLRTSMEALEAWLARNLPAGKTVLIVSDRGAELVAAVLAALRFGAPFLVVDAAAAPHLLDRGVEESAAGVAVMGAGVDDGTAAQLRLRLPTTGCDPDINVAPDERPGAAARSHEPGAAAYMTWTSGTGGKPQLVKISRQSFACYLSAITQAFRLDEDAVVLQLAEPGFDVSLEEILPTLCAGGRVVASGFPDSAGLSDLCGEIEKHCVTVVNMPAALWEAWFNDLTQRGAVIPSCLRLVIVGSEPVDIDTARDWQARYGERIRLLNAYGTAQTSITNLIYEVPSAARCLTKLPRLPIGAPLPGQFADIVDIDGDPVPPGVVGEIRLSGPTAPQPFLTGDLGRRRYDGAIEFLARRDRLVKRLGHSVDLGGLETLLDAHRDIARSQCYLDGRGPSAKIVAHVWPRPGLEAELASTGLPSFERGIREALAMALPRCRAPDRIVIETSSRRRAGRALPSSTAEAALLEIWSTVLGADDLGVHDMLFESGATSMDCLRVLAQARHAGIAIDMRTIYDNHTIAKQAAHLPQ